jgi:hypothetical protein
VTKEIHLHFSLRDINPLCAVRTEENACYEAIQFSNKGTATLQTTCRNKIYNLIRIFVCDATIINRVHCLVKFASNDAYSTKSDFPFLFFFL